MPTQLTVLPARLQNQITICSVIAPFQVHVVKQPVCRFTRCVDKEHYRPVVPARNIISNPHVSAAAPLSALGLVDLWFTSLTLSSSRIAIGILKSKVNISGYSPNNKESRFQNTKQSKRSPICPMFHRPEWLVDGEF
jgi:hypothetical protein